MHRQISKLTLIRQVTMSCIILVWHVVSIDRFDCIYIIMFYWNSRTLDYSWLPYVLKCGFANPSWRFADLYIFGISKVCRFRKPMLAFFPMSPWRPFWISKWPPSNILFLNILAILPLRIFVSSAILVFSELLY